MAIKMPVKNDNKTSDNKKWKIATIIASVVAFCGIGFGIYGMTRGSILIDPLADIDVWEVDSYIEGDTVVYKASGESSIANDQKEGWQSLLKEKGIVCHTRSPKIAPGNTVHIEKTIKMKNGDVYKLLWLGNQEQVNITTPDGRTTKYQCYYR